MPNPSKNQRRPLLVLSELQGKILLQTTALPLAAVAGLMAAAAILGRRLISEAALADADLPTLEALLIDVLCLGAGMVGAILYVAYRFSHRIAGPAQRVIQSLERIGNGDVDFEVEERRGDLLTEVTDQLNVTLRTLQQRRNAAAPAAAAPAAATEAGGAALPIVEPAHGTTEFANARPAT